MRNIFRCVFIVCALCSSAALQAQDISGSYILNVSQDPGADDCVWIGTLDMIQSGGNPGSFTGSAAVSVVSGGGTCFDFAGSVSGTINGNTLDIGVAVGGLGSAAFVGMVSGSGDLAGTWSGLGLTGAWSGERRVETPVPTIPQWGLLLLIALISGFGLRYSRIATLK